MFKVDCHQIVKKIQIILLILLSGFLIWKGIYPALTALDSDFPNYYTASRLFVEGKDISNIYDDVWFQSQIYSYGINRLGKFSPWPPVTIFVMTPLATFTPLNALRAWTIFNLIVLILIIMLISKITGKNTLWSSLLLLSSGLALSNNFRLGQMYLLLLLSVAGSYYFLEQRKVTASGILLTFGSVVKYFPVIFLPLYIIKKEWKLLMISGISMLCVVGVTYLILGKEIHSQFLSHVLMNHLSGNIQDPFSSTFQSWNSLLRRLFIFDEHYNAHPFLPSPGLYYLFIGIIYGTVITLTVLACLKARQIFGNSSSKIQWALITICGLLLLPAGATYHFLLLCFPVGIFLSLHNQRWSVPHWILLALYAGLGFIPYSVVKSFDGQGLLTIIAYPRLYMMTAIFVTSFLIVWRQNNDKIQASK